LGGGGGRFLGTMYSVHLGFTIKHVVDFLLLSIKLLPGVMAEALRANVVSKSAISLQRGPVDPKFKVEVVTPHQPFSFSQAK